ncbi:PID-CTERM protein-sorting domain-containing protein [Mesonia sp.]|uniref:PID-CTERM protein-sorting domain-containing protein n=1 Tax=Mesonia sp. TaxID=1960830 RepID=UPI001763EC41|nr:hypothetical protein [Mesonia sp.]HIB37269.1 hypothetical protein [Mesonia sp.]
MNRTKKILLVLMVAFATIPAFSFQGRPEPGDDPTPPPPGFPIDGFVSVFIAAGAVMGIRSINKKK